MHNISKAVKKLPKSVLRLMELAGQTADALGFPAYVVGGFVRDIILGVKNYDMDIAVEGDGIKFAGELSAKLNAALISHGRFGTATVVMPDGGKIDIATCRRETYDFPGSLPKVTSGAIRDDLARRDFTINAMGFSIHKDSFGQLLDFFGGCEDIRRKKIRVLHDKSFIDDPTRILRAIRFEQRYAFNIQARTLRLMKAAVSIGMLNKVSKHRLRDELILILKEGSVIKCIGRMRWLCGFSFIQRGIAIGPKKLALLKEVSVIYQWFQKKFPAKRKLDYWLLYLMVLLEGLGDKQIEEVLEEFAFNRGEKMRILSFESQKALIQKELKKKLTPSRVYRLLEPLSYEVILLLNLRDSHKSVARNIEDFFCHYNGAKVFLRGEDLKFMGFKPGPDFSRVLKQALFAKLDKKLKTKGEEISYLKRELLGK